MKKRWISFLMTVAVILAMTACQSTSQNRTNGAGKVKSEQEMDAAEEIKTAEETNVVEAIKAAEEEPYDFQLFSEELSLTVDGRNFRAEDAPENAAEEAVFQYFTANFLEDIELYIESCAEYMRSSPEIENTRENFENNSYQINALVLHELETVTVEELTAAGADYRVHPEETEEQYALTETLIIRAGWTEEREEPVNYGNGSHSRYYVCGKTQADPVWRIYEWGFM